MLKNLDPKLPIIFEAYDKDTASSDHLGSTKPIESLTEFEGIINHEVEILDSKNGKVGSLNFSSQLHWVDYVPPPTICDKRSLLKVVIKSATFLKDADLLGK